MRWNNGGVSAAVVAVLGSSSTVSLVSTLNWFWTAWSYNFSVHVTNVQPAVYPQTSLVGAIKLDVANSIKDDSIRGSKFNLVIIAFWLLNGSRLLLISLALLASISPGLLVIDYHFSTT